MDTNELQKRLEIPDDDEAVKSELKAAIGEMEPENIREADSRGEKEYTFELNYKDARGKIWGGRFVNKILSLQERQMAGALQARYSGGVQYGSLDPLTQEINLMLAHLQFSLQDCPKWSKNSLREVADPGIVQAIYAEVASHEAYFLGWGETPEESAEDR